MVAEYRKSSRNFVWARTLAKTSLKTICKSGEKNQGVNWIKAYDQANKHSLSFAVIKCSSLGPVILLTLWYSILNTGFPKQKRRHVPTAQSFGKQIKHLKHNRAWSILNAFTAISIKHNDNFPMWHIVLLKLFERSKMLSPADLCCKEEQIKVNWCFRGYCATAELAQILLQ